jgi:hypothetical protein
MRVVVLCWNAPLRSTVFVQVDGTNTNHDLSCSLKATRTMETMNKIAAKCSRATAIFGSTRLPIGLDMAKEFDPAKVPESQKSAKS